jgi:hypothetical protein
VIVSDETREISLGRRTTSVVNSGIRPMAEIWDRPSEKSDEAKVPKMAKTT